MHTKRIQLVNYGPIDGLDIAFPFVDDKPKPVLLVGANGSGKSILLSHIVNGLLLSQQLAYPETPEVEKGRVYKFRSSTYIKSDCEFSFASVHFDQDIGVSELQLRQERREYADVPSGIEDTDAINLWHQMQGSDTNRFSSQLQAPIIRQMFRNNCVLYFPFNRFEDPAWLNLRNLQSEARHMGLTHISDHTDRRVLSHSPLHNNENWLYDVAYDYSVFEQRTHSVAIAVEQPDKSRRIVPLPVFQGYFGSAKSLYDVATDVVRTILRGSAIRFGIGTRTRRVVSVMEGERMRVHNVFQLSSGEVSLLNIFLSILRDFDLCETEFTRSDEVRGVVVVDEIDLHLHADHQYDVLPRLVQMFPRVQFILTTHSPLLVLGMQRLLGETGFGLYRLPQGEEIGAEEFTEFGRAYHVFKETSRFVTDVRAAVAQVQKPLIFVDGETDVRYLQRAIELLNWSDSIHDLEIRGAGGDANLKQAWKTLTRMTVRDSPVVLVHDCDSTASPRDSGNVFRRRTPKVEGNPICGGIENLFSKRTLQRARAYKVDFIDTTAQHRVTRRGEEGVVPETWMINSDEKNNLCEWLCQNGTAEDFRYFDRILGELQGISGIGRSAESDGGDSAGAPE